MVNGYQICGPGTVKIRNAWILVINCYVAKVHKHTKMQVALHSDLFPLSYPFEIQKYFCGALQFLDHILESKCYYHGRSSNHTGRFYID